MAPGDLNLKKSWYPKLMKNQAKVWEMEQEALQEHKRIAERQAEFEKEKQRKELVDLQIKNNPELAKKLRSGKIDWMYDDPNKNRDGSYMSERERDEFLLGKKKIEVSGIRRPAGAEEKTPSSRRVRDQDRLAGALAMGKPAAGAASRPDLSSLDPMAKIRAMGPAVSSAQRERLLREKQSRDSSRIRPDYEARRRDRSAERDGGRRAQYRDPRDGYRPRKEHGRHGQHGQDSRGSRAAY